MGRGVQWSIGSTASPRAPATEVVVEFEGLISM